jgi:hypothetical protein
MKKLFVIAMLVMAIHKTQAQDTITFYQMNKVQLAQIYLTEVNRVTKKMPTIAFDSTMADIPKSKYLGAKFRKVTIKMASYQEKLFAEYAEIIPYADKRDLINAIIYLRGL